MYPNFVAFGAQPITKVPLVRQHNEALSAGERFLFNASILGAIPCNVSEIDVLSETVFHNM
jgi:hypothetical protein